MSVLSGQEIVFPTAAPFSQVFSCSLSDLIGPGYPPTDIETFAIEGATAAVTYSRRGDLLFRTACDATATISGNTVTMSVTQAEIEALPVRRGRFTIDVSNGVERWRVVDGLWSYPVPTVS